MLKKIIQTLTWGLLLPYSDTNNTTTTTCSAEFNASYLAQRLRACADFELFVPQNARVNVSAKSVVFFADIHDDHQHGQQLLACAQTVAQDIPSDSFLSLTEDKMALTPHLSLKSWDDNKACEDMVRLYVHHHQLVHLKILYDAYTKGIKERNGSDRKFSLFLQYQAPTFENLTQSAKNYPAIKPVKPVVNQLLQCFARSNSFRYCFRTLRILHAKIDPLSSNKKNFKRLRQNHFNDLLWLIQIQPFNVIRNRALIQSINHFLWSPQSILFVFGGGLHFASAQWEPRQQSQFTALQKETNGTVLNGKPFGDDQLMVLRYYQQLSSNRSHSVNFFLIQKKNPPPSLSDEFNWVPYKGKKTRT